PVEFATEEEAKKVAAKWNRASTQNRYWAEPFDRQGANGERSHATRSTRADLIFRNAEDTHRVRVFRRDSGRWDYDVFTKGRGVETYSTEAGDDFRTRAAAKWHALENTDANIEINPATVTEGW